MLERRGLFITFDGPNGVGKSSLLDGVKEQLIQLNFEIFGTKEPTSSQLGQFARNGEEVYNGLVFACLIAADRYTHIEHEILPTLSANKIVLCDRYVESSLVLQRMDGVDFDYIWSLNSQVYIPDLSIILSARQETIDNRLAQRTTYSRFERSKARSNESSFYRETAEFLAHHGFNILAIDNDSTPLETNIGRIVHEIQTLSELRNRQHET
jgi:dTMP kinase